MTFKFLASAGRKYDVIHVFGVGNVPSAAVSYAKMTKKPLIVELVNEGAKPHQSEPSVIRRVWGGRLPSQSAIVCISEELKDVCLSFGYQDNVWSRPNPVDERSYRPAHEQRDELRSQITRFSSNDIVLTSVAKFMPRKNQSFLIEVLSHLPINYKLCLAGPLTADGPLAERNVQYWRVIEDRISEFGLAERVELHEGFVKDVDRYMKMADIYLFPSISDGLGTPVLEAIACGVPVVANRIPGVTDVWVKDGKNGYLSDLDAKHFAQAVLSATQLDREQMGRESQKILDVASTDVIDQGYVELLQGISKGTDPATVVTTITGGSS